MQTNITEEAKKIIEKHAGVYWNTKRPTRMGYSHMIEDVLTDPELLKAQRLSSNEWISVKDRLPVRSDADEYGQVDILVICSDNTFNRNSARYDAIEGRELVMYWATPRLLPSPPTDKQP